VTDPTPQLGTHRAGREERDRMAVKLAGTATAKHKPRGGGRPPAQVDTWPADGRFQEPADPDRARLIKQREKRAARRQRRARG
jgi:hypothetical protein